MPDKDPFEGAYGRLAATRVTPPPRPAPRVVLAGQEAPALRWAASRLLPRLTALAPKRRQRRARPIGD
jgi:alkanesulfonate monooxygenase SsuD/methylene tetrahydromethanopterin reductase-like flavin-dependent oxidoreductase (luciferase family)